MIRGISRRSSGTNTLRRAASGTCIATWCFAATMCRSCRLASATRAIRKSFGIGSTGFAREGIEALAVPHNMNQSDGLAFPETTWKGGPITKEFALKRMRNEPIAEISQKKGTSEVHPSLSPNDEWADFQIVQYFLNRAEQTDPISIFKGGYWRDALKTGLTMEGTIGANPYQLGAIGASDSHVSAGLVRRGQPVRQSRRHAAVARFRLYEGSRELGGVQNGPSGDPRLGRARRRLGRGEYARVVV